MPPPMSPTATTGIITFTSLFIGYCLGRLSVSVQTKLTTRTITQAQIIQPAKVETKGDPSTSSDDSEEEDNTDLSNVSAGLFEQCKLVLCVRTDLNMSTGKIAAQCGHATLACYKSLIKSNPALIKHWEKTGQAKIALKCPSEEELLLLQAKAQSLSLCARTIMDAGRTQVDPGTITVLGIGPGPVSLINEVTGKLRLL